MVGLSEIDIVERGRLLARTVGMSAEEFARAVIEINSNVSMKNNMNNLICLGGGVESVPIIQRVKELGFQATVIDGNPNAPGMAIAHEAITASCYHSEGAIAELNARGVKPDGVLCCAVDAPLACAEIAAAFGLPGLSVPAAKLGQNKFDQKYYLRDAGIPVPRFWNTDKERLARLISGAACIIKPVDSRGGRGVIRLLPDVDLVLAYEQAKAQSPTSRVMVEQWLDGPQLSTESIVQNGRVLFTAVGLRNYARLAEFAPYVIEDGFDEPHLDTGGWKLTDSVLVRTGIDVLIERACRALDWYQRGAGTVKGDLVIHDGQLYVIELAPRLSGGFFASHGHLLAYGVDFVGKAIEFALGYSIVNLPQPYPRGFVSQRYVFPAPSDIGKKVIEVKGVRVGEVLRECATWNIHIGQTIEPVTCHPRRWGQILATGATPAEAQTRAELAVQHMKESVVLE